MGVVFLALDHHLDRPVALKVLNAAAQNVQAQARMAREARILARLEHPSIVPIHDAGVLPDGRFYYAMKLVRGKRLDEEMAQPAPLAERLQLFLKICDAVAFAHAHGVLHRDLKPQNIMLGSFGEVLIMDWGVAKEIGDAEPAYKEPAVPEPVPSAQTMHGTVVGTPGYMPPEQARGDIGALDERTDVYAMGAILYFLLTGRAPVTDQSAPLGDAPRVPGLRRPRRISQSIPRPMEAVCLKALAVRPSDRYGTALELSRDISDFLARRRVRAYPEGVMEAGLRLAAKYRTVLVLILAYLVMRILLLVFLGH
jgi:serine/threonine protein kinase